MTKFTTSVLRGYLNTQNRSINPFGYITNLNIELIRTDIDRLIFLLQKDCSFQDFEVFNGTRLGEDFFNARQRIPPNAFRSLELDEMAALFEIVSFAHNENGYLVLHYPLPSAELLKLEFIEITRCRLLGIPCDKDIKRYEKSIAALQTSNDQYTFFTGQPQSS